MGTAEGWTISTRINIRERTHHWLTAWKGMMLALMLIKRGVMMCDEWAQRQIWARKRGNVISRVLSHAKTRFRWRRVSVHDQLHSASKTAQLQSTAHAPSHLLSRQPTYTYTPPPSILQLWAQKRCFLKISRGWKMKMNSAPQHKLSS